MYPACNGGHRSFKTSCKACSGAGRNVSPCLSTSGVPMHSVAANLKVCAASGCARAGPGTRAARHRIRRDDSRMDTAEVEISTTTSCSSSWPRTPGFHLGNAGSNPAHDAINRSPRALMHRED